MNSGSIRNAPPAEVELTIPWDSRSTVSLRDISAQQGNGINIAVPRNTLYTNSMLINSDDIKLMQYTDIIFEIQNAVREISEDNQCEFQTNLSLFLEGVEEDVLDRELPHSIGPLPTVPKTPGD
jgi:type IV secretory pathway ATPase VirB11/archaellum biosynthesis ATPase